MNYKSLYQKIVTRGIHRQRNGFEYYEIHHVIPKCMGGTNDKTNLTLLTAREHYITHWLLCKIYHDTLFIHKLSSAFNNMCSRNKKNGNKKRILTSIQYERARKEYSQHHPMKNPIIRAKVKLSHKIRSEQIKKIKELSLKYCACGCGNKVKNNKYHYLMGHENKTGRNAGPNPLISKKIKNYIDSLSEKEKKQRLLNTLHSDKVDHIQRGYNISKAKKGVKTNQKQITSERLANMSDNEFEIYLKNIKPFSKQRMIKYRNEYLCMKKI